MKRLRKSNDRVLAGVLGGIAEYFGWDPQTLRIVYSIFVILGIGSPILIYLLAALIMPEPNY